MKIPELASFDLTDWKQIDAALATAPSLAFGQSWAQAPEPAFLPGEVRFGQRDGQLLVYAVLQDENPSNPATADNVEAYRMGDVFELFLSPADQRSYFEFHVTPENYQFKLRLEPKPDAPAIAVEVPPSQQRPDLVVHSLTRVEAGRWRAFLRVPLKQLVETPGGSSVWTISCGRYDYAVPGARPVCSSTSPHRGRFFHRRHEWSVMDLGADTRR